MAPKRGGNFPLSESITAKLPPEFLQARALEANICRSSNWASTTQITAILPSGIRRSLFLKVCTLQLSKEMIDAEFHCMSALYSLDSTIVPKPHAVGKINDFDFGQSEKQPFI